MSTVRGVGCRGEDEKEGKKETIQARVNKQRQYRLETLTATQSGAENAESTSEKPNEMTWHYKANCTQDVKKIANSSECNITIKVCMSVTKSSWICASSDLKLHSDLVLCLLSLINSAYLHRACRDNF